jgi:hypothetical protein
MAKFFLALIVVAVTLLIAAFVFAAFALWAASVDGLLHHRRS